MKEKLDKSDLVEEVANIICEDLSFGDKVSLESVLFDVPTENLIKYLPKSTVKDFEFLKL